MAILTLDDLRESYGFSFPPSLDGQYQALLDTAEEEVLGYADIEQGEVTEHFTGPGNRFTLTHCPVLEVLRVEAGGETLAISRFEERCDTVVLASSAGDGVDVAVTYMCGWPEGKAPAVIRQAIAFTAQHLAKLQGGKLLGVTTRNTEGGTETIDQSTPPLAVQRMLARYRRNACL